MVSQSKAISGAPGDLVPGDKSGVAACLLESGPGSRGGGRGRDGLVLGRG